MSSRKETCVPEEYDRLAAAAAESEERFRRIVELSPDAIFIEQEGRIVFANRAVADLLGAPSPEYLIGYDAIERVHLEERDLVRERRVAVQRGEGPNPPVERRFVRFDGSEVTVEVVSFSVPMDGAPSLLVAARDITERRRAESAQAAASRERDHLLNQLKLQTQKNPLACLVLDQRLEIVDWNPAAERLFGYTKEEALGSTPYDLVVPPQTRPHVEHILQRMRSGETGPVGSGVNIRKDGTSLTCEWHNHAIFDEQGRFDGAVSMALDVTERQRLEEGLRQASKMEAVGRLASGVAHDFNNLLTAILGYADLLSRKLDPSDPRGRELDEIRKAALRAASLTNQLLAFSRKQVIQPQILDLRQVVTSIEPMIRRLVGEDIELRIVPSTEMCTIKADPGQIDQVLVNLIVNSRDAMPRGGTLTIATAVEDLGHPSTWGHELIPSGRYVRLCVSDTGVGMNAEHLKHIFEPFFTTKGQGKGTGLGLATVYGIVKQNQGHVYVSSEEGTGTDVNLYLPAVSVKPERVSGIADMAQIPRGGETVLVLEDEAMVRSLALVILKECGYTVLAAASGEEAVLKASQHPGPIHLLLSDVVMPGGSGPEWSEKLRTILPDLRTLFMSGYTDETISHHGFLDPNLSFIQKPFTPAALAHKIRTVLDSAASTPDAPSGA